MTNVEFHFDFGSPNAYLSHLVIPDIERRTGAIFEYVPVLLGGVFKATGNASPMVTLKGIKNKPEYGRLEMQRFIDRYDLGARFERNPHFPVNTLQIMRGAVAANRMDKATFCTYVEAVFDAMWFHPVKMDDPVVIEATLGAADLPASEIIRGLSDSEVKTELIANTERSVERGVFGSPSFFVGDEHFFGKDKLRDVEEEIVRQSGS